MKKMKKNLNLFISVMLVAIMLISAVPAFAAVATISAISLTAVPADHPEVERKWRVTNNNDVEVPFTWKLYGTQISGSSIATSKSQTFFITPLGTNGANPTCIISWLDGTGATKTTQKAGNITKASYTLTTQAFPDEGGTISPPTASFPHDTVVNIVATPKEGYKFVRFQGDLIPDENGNVVVMVNSRVQAVFEALPIKEPVEITTINDIPKGDRIHINFPYAYLYGYEQGNVGGEDDVKREEASALLYRLLKQDNQIGDFEAGSSTFTDVKDARWSKNALMYMKHIGVYKNDYVNPHHAITRGEVAKIITFALRIQPDDRKTISYSDLSGDNSYYWYIKALSDIGIMKGFNGKVNPNDNITRAEYVTILNRIIGRDTQYYVDDLTALYPDLNDKAYWAYDDLMRASFGFTDNKIDGYFKVDHSRKPSREKVDYN
jgi:hypothetical protein